MNNDGADVVAYHVYRQQFDEVFENTENYGRKEFVNEIVYLKNIIKLKDKEKQNLIKYLEDKIEETKMFYKHINGDYGSINYKIESYQEILDKIKGAQLWKN